MQLLAQRSRVTEGSKTGSFLDSSDQLSRWQKWPRAEHQLTTKVWLEEIFNIRIYQRSMLWADMCDSTSLQPKWVHCLQAMSLPDLIREHFFNRGSAQGVSIWFRPLRLDFVWSSEFDFCLIVCVWFCLIDWVWFSSDLLSLDFVWLSEFDFLNLILIWFRHLEDQMLFLVGDDVRPRPQTPV